MKNRLTSFNITTSVKYLEIEILKSTGLPQTVFHRKAIDYFLINNPTIDDELKITRRSDPKYVKKSVTERIYLDSEREKAIIDVARREGTKKTIVLFQALMNYCLKNVNEVNRVVVEKIIHGDYVLEK